MKKLLLTLLITGVFTCPAHGMWESLAKRFASANKFVRAQMPAFAKTVIQATPAAAKATQKPIAQTAKATTAESNWFSRLSKGLASAWQNLKQNFKLPEWIKSSTAKDKIKNAFTAHGKSIASRMPIAGASLAATAIQTAYAQGTKNDMLDFNEDNICNYPRYRSAFIAHAIKNITSQDPQFIQAVAYLLEVSSDSREPITQAALNHFNTVDPLTIKQILAHYPRAKDAFIEKLLTQDNPHLEKLFANYRTNNNPSYQWIISHGDGTAQFSIAKLVINTIVANPGACSIKSFNTIFEEISKIGPDCTELWKLRHTATKHYGQDAATFIALASGAIKKNDITNKPWCVYILYGNHYEIRELHEAIERELETLSVQDLDRAYTFLTQATVNWFWGVAVSVKTTSSPLLNRIQETARKRFKPIDYSTLSTQDILYLHKIKSGFEGHLSKPSLAFEYPLFMLDCPHNATIKEKVYTDLATLPADYLEYAYEHIFTSQAEKDSLKQTIKSRFNDTLNPLHRTHITHAVLEEYDRVPSFLAECSPNNHQPTQTEKHLCANLASVIRNMFRGHQIKQKTNAIALFKQAIAKEREELAKGNHVFYHGRQWEYDFWADMDKATYNLKHPNNPLQDIRLRFDESEGALCLNYALFANATREPSNTASYVIRNHDYSAALRNFSIEKFFNRFNLTPLYTRYHNEFDTLKKMHAACNNHGSLLMISVPDKHLDIVYPALEGSMGYKLQARKVKDQLSSDIREIVNTLKTDPVHIQDGNSDYIEFALRITPELKDKVRIYPMSQADPVKYKEYTDYRDQLFAKIKTDIATHNGVQ